MGFYVPLTGLFCHFQPLTLPFQNPIPPLSEHPPPPIQPASHLPSQPTLITSPPPKESYFLIALLSCSGIPEINSPPLCYSYYLEVLELA